LNSRLSKLRRRDFLKLAGAGGLALSIPILGKELSTEITSLDQNKPFTTYFNAIGTIVEVIIDDPISSSFANHAVNSVSNDVNALGNILTRFPGGTDLCALNQTDCLESPTPDLLSTLKSAISNSESSGGSFDITVKPVLDLLQGYLSGQPFPSDAQFDAAKALINYENVDVSSNLVTLEKPGMGVTLDGIATGYILDHSINVFKSMGIKSALINFGGTLATIGTRADGSLWKVGIVDPLDPTSIIGNVYLKDQAIATSGDYEDYFTPNKEYYHIVDPFTAHSPLFSHAATVVSETAMVADPLGVSLMVEDPASAMDLIDSYPAECLIYTDKDQMLTSSGMKSLMSG